MIRTHTYTAYLSKTTHKRLNNFLAQLTILYNAALEERISAYKKQSKSISRYDQMKSLTEIRKDDEWFSQFRCDAQRSVLIRLDHAYKRFFNKDGFPRFKSQRRGIRSFESASLNVQQGKKWHKVQIKGIGRLKFKGKVSGDIKLVRIVRTALRIKIQLVCEHPDRSVADHRAPIGIDAGVSKLLTLSNGTQIDGRKIDRSNLKRKQRAVSRAKKGSHNRQKKVITLRKEWQRTSERRNGFNHELTAALIKNNSIRFFVEDLNIVNMTKSAKGTKDDPGSNVKAKSGLNRSIMEQRWGDFFNKLGYKAESAGGYVIKVDPKFTSQNCSSCGASKGNNQKVYAVFECLACGYSADRDVNASINVLQRGLNSLSGGFPVRTKQAE